MANERSRKSSSADQTQQRQEETGSGSVLKRKEDAVTPTSEAAASSVPSSVQNNPNSFASLRPSLSSGVLEYVASQKFTQMTPVQKAVIPLFITANKDVAVQACTGSGKTLAFLIPIVESLQKQSSSSSSKSNKVRALILSPTRELARQTYTVTCDLCRACGLVEPLLLVGGKNHGSKNSRPVTADLQKFQRTGNGILIGTPGRVEDVLTKYAVMDSSELECLVLDEADVLLNMGFANTLQHILSKLPKMRRTGLFSATAASSGNSSLQEWMNRAGLRNPVWIDVAVNVKNKSEEVENAGEKNASKSSATAVVKSKYQQQATPTSLKNYYLISPLEEKLSRMSAFLQQHSHEKTIVFFLTCACVEFYGMALKKFLPNNRIELLHGKMVQKRREKTMQRFREERDQSAGTDTNDGGTNTSSGGTLCCTDVAARGLDVSGVQWVVQFDAPQDPSFFVHRVGRSARAGRQGASLVFLTKKEEAYVDFLNMRKVPLSPLSEKEYCCHPLANDDVDGGGGDDDRDEKTTGTSAKVGTTKQAPSDSAPVVENLLPKLRGLCLTDRDILEKGTKAFTSYIRAYKEHHCAFILRYVRTYCIRYIL